MSPEFTAELVALLPRLRRFALSLTGRADEADDLTQAACERALRAADGYEPGTRFDAWLFRIARNLWIDKIRKTRGEGTSVEIDGEFDLAGEDGRAVTAGRLDLADVDDAMASLAEDQRAVVTLVCVEDLSYAETAERLGVPIGTVMSRLSRARAALKTALERKRGAGPPRAKGMPP
jgi:RNA polymerase sigma-70 factor (ECF subfamily)